MWHACRRATSLQRKSVGLLAVNLLCFEVDVRASIVACPLSSHETFRFCESTRRQRSHYPSQRHVWKVVEYFQDVIECQITRTGGDSHVPEQSRDQKACMSHLKLTSKHLSDAFSAAAGATPKCTLQVRDLTELVCSAEPPAK